MAMTFLDLTNEVLRAFNQVELTSGNFETSRGVHSWAKDGVNNAIRIINTKAHNWPFNAVEHTETLVAGTYEYAWPTTFKTADWNSFQIQYDEDLNVNFKTLRLIERDEFYRRYKDDADAGILESDNRSVPAYVFRTHGVGFGIHPNPDQAYELKYRYYKYSTSLSAYSDETNIPEQFRHVIISSATMYVNKMMAGQAYVESEDQYFRDYLTHMRSLLINDEIYAQDTRVKY